VYAGPDDLTGDLRDAVIDLLYRLADDDLVIGHRNSEWTGLAPILEADIAFSSMAQDEIGHALAYYRLLRDLGESDPDTLAFTRSADAFRCAALVALDKGDWAFSVMRQYLYDAAEMVRLVALTESAYKPLADLARKIRGEEKYHLMHGRTWVQRLGNATEESHKRMQAAIEVCYPRALALFEPTRWDETLSSTGVQPSEAELCATWKSRVVPVLSEAGLDVPQSAKPTYGGRAGRHPPELAELIGSMQKVFRLDPAAQW
jgi:ring-1,2-phenylacetyl-CoA epoxidase subunit PaaC